jgi:UDP-N-acetylglucosamine acyltransferase
MAVTIHPTAIVDPKAELADDVEIGAYAVVEGDVQIGKGTKVHHHAFIGTGARIGERCQVHHTAVVSNVPQDLKFKGTEKTYVELGDDSVIREFATIHRGTVHDADTNAGTHDSVTRIGRGVLVMAYSHIAHDCSIGEGVILSNSTQLAGHVTVEDMAILGGATLVHQFCMVGTLCMIGGGVMIRKDVPPFSLVGERVAKFSGINRIGLTRRGKTVETLQAIKSVYFTLYHSGMNVSTAVKAIANSPEAELPEIQIGAE